MKNILDYKLHAWRLEELAGVLSLVNLMGLTIKGGNFQFRDSQGTRDCYWVEYWISDEETQEDGMSNILDYVRGVNVLDLYQEVLGVDELSPEQQREAEESVRFELSFDSN